VSTIGSRGPNLAPFSYFNVAAIDPCVVMFSIGVPTGDRVGTVKDTLDNLRTIPEFVLHLVDRSLAESMELTSDELPSHESEFGHAGLTELSSIVVRPPRVAEAAVQMECRLVDTIPVGRIPYHLILGEVVMMHVRKGLVNERHHVDTTLHQPIARLGSPGLYTTINNGFQIQKAASHAVASR
jgi:flavin reductase (DIM6/NTAB) family NADH-FMN oxidoreductase RutF